MFGTVDYHGVNARWWVCRFAGEEGSDAGGLWRDCMSNIADELMSNRTPLFINSGNAVDGEVWVLNPACHDNVKFRFLGQLFGACIRHPAETLPINLAPYIWKKLAGKPVTWEDFSAVAPKIAASIGQIEKMECSEEEFEDLCLDFTFTMLGGVEVELTPGGADRYVTLADRAEFCELAKQACMNQFDSQISLIRSGLDDYSIPAVALLLWTPDEFQTQVAGSLEIPVEALRKGIQVSGDNDQKKYFWEAIERMTNEQRSMMLKFATGRSRLPLHMTLNLGRGSGRYGRSATCSFEMYLPTFEDADDMYDGLVTTIACGSFGND